MARQFWHDVIATPTRGEVGVGFTCDLVQLTAHSPQAIFIPAVGSYIPNNRIALVNQALALKAPYILFIDSDMRFPADTLERLVKADKDIVGANYRQRTQDEWTARSNGRFVSSAAKSGLEEVDTLGLGVTLINMKVFNGALRKIPEPWFAMPYHTQDKKLVGEDVYFCTVAKEQGFKIWIDHDLSQEVKHTRTVEL